jgi:hypothetical protein
MPINTPREQLADTWVLQCGSFPGLCGLCQRTVTLLLFIRMPFAIACRAWLVVVAFVESL